MLVAPGAIAAPTKAITEGTTKSCFRAWKVSEADEMIGEMTACTSDKALGIHV